MVDPVMLTVSRILTFEQQRPLTNASGFFSEHGERLYLATSRHVVYDEPSKHFPDRLEIEFHADSENTAYSTGFSIPLYRDGESLWGQARDSAGEVDVAVIQLDRWALPASAFYRAFTPAHLHYPPDAIEIGTALLIVGFPLGFHDLLHHMPVVRHAVVASSFGLRRLHHHAPGQKPLSTDQRTQRAGTVRTGAYDQPPPCRIFAARRDPRTR